MTATAQKSPPLMAQPTTKFLVDAIFEDLGGGVFGVMGFWALGVMGFWALGL